MADYVFDVAAFRAQFPEFASEAQYPDAVLSGYFAMATCYIAADGCPCSCLPTDCWAVALNQLTAHFARLFANVANGVNPGQITGATIDKVSVTLESPPSSDQWSWWLNLTPYGQMLLALLSGMATGGFYVGSLPERSAFRSVGGVFPPGGRWLR